MKLEEVKTSLSRIKYVFDRLLGTIETIQLYGIEEKHFHKVFLESYKEIAKDLSFLEEYFKILRSKDKC